MLKKVFNKIKNLILKVTSKVTSVVLGSTTISTALVFLFFFLCFGLIYFNMPTLVSADDHYFHIRFAEKIAQMGFFEPFRDFQSLYYTKIASGQHFIYYNFLFYLVLIPFTLFTPLYFGIKLYGIFIIALIATALYKIIKSLNIKYAFVFTILFFSAINPGILTRLFLARPFVLAPIFLLVFTIFLHKKKYLWASILAFVYLYWHTATFFMPLVIASIFFVVTALYENRYNWKILTYTVLGTGSALILVNIIDSGFFTSIHDNIISVTKNIATGGDIKIQEGGELYKRNFFDYFYQNLILFILFLSTIIFQVFNYFNERRNIINLPDFLKKRRTLEISLFFFTSLLFLAIFNISFRFSDTFIFFAWFYIMFALSNIIDKIKVGDVIIRKALFAILGTLVVFLFAHNLIKINDEFAVGSRPAAMEKVGNYLSENLEQGEIVFNADWSWFPQLYYYAPEQNYIIGLEPKLTYDFDKNIYFVWYNLGQGIVCDVEDCSSIIKDRTKHFRKENTKEEWYKKEGDKIAIVVKKIFNSNYIVSSNDYSNLNDVLDNNKNFEMVLEDVDFGFYVYKIK